MNAKLDYDQFHQDMEVLRRKYNVAIAYYFEDDVAMYLQDTHGFESDNAQDVAHWIWQNTKVAKNIHAHINNPEVVESFFENGLDEYLARNRKAQ